MNEVIDFRIEAEYFSKKFLKIDDILSKIKTVEFIKAAKPVNGRAYDSESFNCDNGIFISKIGDVTNKRQIITWEKVTNQEFVRQKGKLLKDNDILMTLTGDPPDVGKVNLINCNDIKCTWNQRVAKIVLDKNIYLSNNILYAVLSCELIRRQMERFAKGIRQRNLGNDCFKYVLLPVFSMEFQTLLDFIISEHKNMLALSQEEYAKAEYLLNSELGLENFNPSSEKVSIKPLKDSFHKTGRLDSEYYQGKYDDYLKKVFSYSNGYELLGECCTIKDKSFMPKDDEKYRYIELANVGNNAQISDCDVLIGKELPTRARRKVNTGDVIVSSIEGSLESCALITEEYNHCLCSTGFYVVNSEKINSESLLTIFKSSLMLNLMKKGCSGTILMNIRKEEFAKLPIPILKQNVQDEIASYIKQSMEYLKKAKDLLDISIKAVEIAVEKDEQTAQNFLDKQTDPN